jgi:uncharacterized membrane protein YidH (DUF202 family)
MLATLRFAIPMPDRVPMRWVIAAAGALLLAQALAGTSAMYAQLVFLFVLLSGISINLAGGLSRVGGFCIAMMSLKLVIISQVAKSFFGEPGDSRLQMPVTTIGILLVGLASVTIAVALVRFVRVRKHLFVTDASPESLRIAAIITFALGAVSHLGVMRTGVEDGALQVGGLPGLLRQWSFCLSLAVVFSTAYVIQKSGGRRLLGWFNGLPVGLFFALGVLSASKQGMIEPLVLVGLTAVAFRFQFALAHLVAGAMFLALAVGVLFPFGQVARNYTRGYGFVETITTTAEFAAKHFTSVEGFRQLHEQYDDAAERAELTQYYERTIGLLERVSLIKMVDLLVSATAREGESEWDTITHGFKMVLPRFIYPNKPAINTGTYLGKKAGVISEDDWGTQISFGFIADAYSAFGWTGVALIPGIVTACFLLLFNWLVGPLERNVWCVYFFAEFQHFFAEQTISAMTLTILRRPIWLVAIYLLIRIACYGWRMWNLERDAARNARETAIRGLPAGAVPR